MQRAKLFGALFAYANNIQITWKTIHLYSAGQTVHLQIKKKSMLEKKKKKGGGGQHLKKKKKKKIKGAT